MSSPVHSPHESMCKYLFSKEAEGIFHNLTFSKPIEKRQFIEQCLNLMVRVNIFFLTHKDGFFLIDPMAFNNQCHLYALKAAQIKAIYGNKTEEEKLAKTEENRFLHLSFFLTYALASDTTLFINAVQAAMQQMNVQAPLPKKKFMAFLRDEGRYREKASRLALNIVFERSIKETFALPKEENTLLYSELFQMAHESLQMVSSRGPKEGEFYTYPKLAGVAYLVDTLAQERIPFVIKVRVITKEGAAGTIIQASEEVQENVPVLIFEALATDGFYSVPYCREEAKHCPTYFYRYSETNKRHKENETCFFCKTTTLDLAPFRHRLRLAMQSPQEMFYALGADFILQVQHDFKALFENREKYPLLAKIFERAIPKIKELGLDMHHPLTFSVCHVHADSASHALSEQLLLNSHPEALLKSRGII